MYLQPTFEAIAALCDDRASETLSLEFKLEPPGKLEQEKAEFAKDVVALANRGGGIIIYGISESEGVAESVAPITNIDADSLTRRLGQIVDAAVEPRLDVFKQHVVAAPDGGFVLMIEIGGSIAGPHRLNLGDKCRFVVREATYIRNMTYDEIRQSFLKESEVSERMRAFRSERCAAIANEDATIEGAPSKCLVHTIPLSVIRGAQSFSLQLAEKNWSRFLNHEWGGGSHSFNLDGFMAYRRSEKPSEFVGYCQVYRSGITETCLRASSFWEDRSHIIPAVSLCEAIKDAVASAITEYKEQSISGSMLIFTSLVSVKGRELAVNNRRFAFETHVSDRDILSIPEALVKDLNSPEAVEEAERFLFDIIWQSFGYSACNYYDAQGNWTPPR
jgi:hypothetical protein